MMDCKYFGICGSCTLPLAYDEQLKVKTDEAKELFCPHVEFETITSPTIHYRNRAEFGVWKEGEEIDFCMNGVEKNKVMISFCPKADEQINYLLNALKPLLESNEILKSKLFGVEFINDKKDTLVTLIYHKKLDSLWEKEARELQNTLQVKIVGRSRGQKVALSEDFVLQTLHVDGKEYLYKLYEGAFSQPNSRVNEQMIGWVKSKLSGCEDLLELYCGHGNFTIPLSEKFNKVLATEVSKGSINSAKSNCELNNTTNISFVRLSAQELVSAFNKEREFVRLKEIDLDEFSFSHIFVDPPRAGIDEQSLEFTAKFTNIIYISCNKDTLKRDLEMLLKTHTIKHFAFFDQFAYTKHLECGVILSRL